MLIFWFQNLQVLMFWCQNFSTPSPQKEVGFGRQVLDVSVEMIRLHWVFLMCVCASSSAIDFFNHECFCTSYFAWGGGNISSVKQHMLCMQKALGSIFHLVC